MLWEHSSDFKETKGISWTLRQNESNATWISSTTENKNKTISKRDQV